MTKREELRGEVAAAARRLHELTDRLVEDALGDHADDDDACAGYAPPEVRAAFARAVAEKLDREIMGDLSRETLPTKTIIDCRHFANRLHIHEPGQPERILRGACQSPEVYRVFGGYLPCLFADRVTSAITAADSRIDCRHREPLE